MLYLMDDLIKSNFSHLTEILISSLAAAYYSSLHNIFDIQERRYS
jgi:hypothetical protein